RGSPTISTGYDIIAVARLFASRILEHLWEQMGARWGPLRSAGRKGDVYMKERVEGFDFSEMTYLYQGLKALIEQGEGVGFHNADMGHLTCRIGAAGDTDVPVQDSPEQSLLFQMLSELSRRLIEGGEIASSDLGRDWYDFSTWEKFCQFAVRIYEGQDGET
ncbi:MAG: hypothetical protein RRA32_10330, partial [bacterium]|nr:hypothetical protein [bacterium]